LGSDFVFFAVIGVAGLGWWVSRWERNVDDDLIENLLEGAQRRE
jgi:hypothetical protein